MKFSILSALTLCAVGVMAAPVEKRAVECRGILNGDIRKYTFLYRGNHADLQYPATVTHLSRVMAPQPSLATETETVTQAIS